MEFRILGSFEVDIGGVIVPLGGARERMILAVMVVEAGRTVPLARLVDAVWDDHPPETAVKQVRNVVSRLRQVLSGHGTTDVIKADSTGYRLSVPAETIDARRFEALVAQASSAARTGDIVEAAAKLGSALDLWRGPPLDGMTGQVLETVATAWEERRRAAQETYFEHMLALGRHGQIAVALSAVLAEAPWREKIAAQLMLALYRGGRQADSLAVYRDLRTHLDEELGLDPGLELQRLHQQILTRDPALDLPAERAGSGGTGTVIPRQLPAGVRHFVGRDHELKQLSELLSDVGAGAVVITAIGGTAGIGKTALAVHWSHKNAHRFPDGQLYVNLRGFDPAGTPMEPREAIRGFLDALAVPPQRIPSTLDEQGALYRSLLAGKRMLIVLDNARDVGQVRPLLPGASTCLVLVTSRRQLTGLVAAEGARPVTLGLLTHAEAQELLIRHLGRERVERELRAADGLVRKCALLPLALSIIAARAATQPSLPLAALEAELREARGRLDALDAGDPAADVRAVFSWSLNNLSPAGARMFRLLGLHPGLDTSLPAAASLAGVPRHQARAALTALTEAHMATEHMPGRYTFHDLLRAYAAEQAQDHDTGAGRDEAIRRVLDHYVHTANTASRLLYPKRDPLILPAPRAGTVPEDILDQDQALAWFEAERPVLIAATSRAFGSGFDSYAWQIAWATGDFLQRRGHWHDWVEVERIAVAAAERLGDVAGRARALRVLGRAHIQLGAYAEADTCLEQALALYRQLGDFAGQGHTHLSAGWLFDSQGRQDEAIDQAQLALDMFRAASHAVGQADALNALGWCHILHGNYEEGLKHCYGALDLHTQLDNRVGASSTWDSLGFAHHHLGNYGEAVHCYEQALALCREMADPYRQSGTLIHLGDTYQAAADTAAARRTWQQALELLEGLQHPDAASVRAKLAQLA